MKRKLALYLRAFCIGIMRAATYTMNIPKQLHTGGIAIMSSKIRTLTLGATLLAIGISLIRGRRARAKRYAFYR